MPSARLLPRWARLYPGIYPGRWYQVVGEEPLGLWLADAGGDPFVTQGRRFLPREHVELGP